jgi:hypothetical protein
MAGLLQRERSHASVEGKRDGRAAPASCREEGEGEELFQRAAEDWRPCVAAPSFSPVFYFCFSTYVVSPLVYHNLFGTKRLVCCSLFVVFTKGQLSAHSSHLHRVQKGMCSTDTDACISIQRIRIRVSVSGGYGYSDTTFYRKT